MTPISEAFEPEFAELVRHYLKDSPAAFEAAQMLWSAAHVIDDLVDQDKDHAADVIVGAFWVFAVGLRNNGFWREFEHLLQPLLEQALYDWLDSIYFEWTSNHPAAFILRGSLISVYVKMAEILGGLDWARDASRQLRDAVFDDYEDFVDGLGERAG